MDSLLGKQYQETRVRSRNSEIRKEKNKTKQKWYMVEVVTV